ASLGPVGDRPQSESEIAHVAESRLVEETAVAEHVDGVTETEVLVCPHEVGAVGTARRPDERDVGAGAGDLGRVGAEVRGAQGIPQLVDDLASRLGEGADESAAVLPTEGVVGAEGDRLPVSLL